MFFKGTVPEAVAYSSNEAHEEEEADAEEDICVDAPLDFAAFVSGATIVQHGFCFMACVDDNASRHLGVSDGAASEQKTLAAKASPGLIRMLHITLKLAEMVVGLFTHDGTVEVLWLELHLRL